MDFCPQSARMVIKDSRGDEGQGSVAVGVGRHSCRLSGYYPPQLPFLTGDGKSPLVSEYRLSILPDTATKQSLPINQT